MPHSRLARIVPAIVAPLAIALIVGCDTSSPSAPRSTGPNPPTQTAPGNPGGSPVTQPGNSGGGGGQTRTLSFATDVGPIFKQNCAQCHSPSGSAYRRAPICDSAGNPDYTFVHANVSELLNVLQGGQMPPSHPLSASDVQAIQAWASEGSPNN